MFRSFLWVGISLLAASTILDTAACEKLKNKIDCPSCKPPSIRCNALRRAIVVFPLPGPPVTSVCPVASSICRRFSQILRVTLLLEPAVLLQPRPLRRLAFHSTRPEEERFAAFGRRRIYNLDTQPSLRDSP